MCKVCAFALRELPFLFGLLFVVCVLRIVCAQDNGRLPHKYLGKECKRESYFLSHNKLYKVKSLRRFGLVLL